VCTGTNWTVCTALDQCHLAGTCNAATGACSNPLKPEGTSCNDDDPCSPVDFCHDDGQCWGPLSNPQCDGSPQVKPEPQLGVAPGYITPTFFVPMANPGAVDLTAPNVSTMASGLNNAGTVVGFTQNGISEGPAGTQASPFVADATGQ